MKKLRYIVSFLLILSMVSTGALINTKDTAFAASAITISDKTLTLEVDHYKTLRIKGTNSYVSWKSDNTRVATVTKAGKVYAHHTGTANITASVNGKKLTCKLNVIYVKKEVTLDKGKSYTLPLTGTKGKAEWSSNNKSVATVSDTGKVKAIAPGTATITVKVDGKTMKSYVTVINGINYKNVVLELGGWTGYVEQLKFSPNMGKVKWTSSDSKIATISSSGLVTAKGPGTATITASVNGIKSTSKVTVLKLSSKKLTIDLTGKKQLKVYGTSEKVQWYSNKKSVATVSSNGTITPIRPGKATITAVVNGIELDAEVTIK
jgi:chitinase